MLLLQEYIFKGTTSSEFVLIRKSIDKWEGQCSHVFLVKLVVFFIGDFYEDPYPLPNGKKLVHPEPMLLIDTRRELIFAGQKSNKYSACSILGIRNKLTDDWRGTMPPICYLIFVSWRIHNIASVMPHDHFLTKSHLWHPKKSRKNSGFIFKMWTHANSLWNAGGDCSGKCMFALSAQSEKRNGKCSGKSIS